MHAAFQTCQHSHDEAGASFAKGEARCLNHARAVGDKCVGAVQLSGIGPTATLQGFGIPIVADLPVGEDAHVCLCPSTPIPRSSKLPIVQAYIFDVSKETRKGTRTLPQCRAHSLEAG